MSFLLTVSGFYFLTGLFCNLIPLKPLLHASLTHQEIFHKKDHIEKSFRRFPHTYFEHYNMTTSLPIADTIKNAI